MTDQMPMPPTPLEVVDVAMVREVLLGDTWHVLEPGSLRLIELQWLESRDDGAPLSASSTGFRFVEGAPRGFTPAEAASFWPSAGVEIIGRLDAVLAVKR